MFSIKRGEIYFANLGSGDSLEIGGMRPVIVLQGDIINRYLPTVIVAPITSNRNRKLLPTHVAINAGQGGLNGDSVILLEQIRVIDKSRLKSKVGSITEELMNSILSNLNSIIGDRKIPNELESEDNYNLTKQQYEEFYNALKGQADSVKEIHDILIKSGSYRNRAKDWVFGGIIGAIFSAIVSIILNLL